MKDLFDEFMEELRRRAEAEAGGRPRPEAARGAGEAEDTPGGDAGEDPRAGQDAEEAPEPERPRESERRRATGRAGGGRRGPGGPADGAGLGGRAAEAGRRFGLSLAIILIIAIVALASFGLDLWTDVIWYTSVGFEGVFWTRLQTQGALFAGGLAIALIALFGNLWLAGRLLPPPESGLRGPLHGLFDRLGEASRNAGGGWTGPGPGGPGEAGGPLGGWGAPGGAGRRSPGGRPPGPRPIVIEGEELPDLAPLGRVIIAGVAILFALGIAGAASGAWETILLFQHRVPFAATGAAVVDPIFGRDIGFFLFDLPFFRLVQALANALLLGALLVSLGRYLVGALRGSLVFSAPVRVHLAVLAGLYLVSVAAGYQLDKLELVYSARGVATGVSYTDANAQFMALDVLTVIAALSGAFLVGGAFTRMLWPLGMAVGIWLVASLVLGQLYPEFVQRFTVEPNQFAQERPYIANNIAMTRLAYGLDRWERRDYSGEAPLTATAVEREKDTFDNARVWDYRPLRDVLDQLQTVRQYYDFVDVDTDRYQIGGAERQVMLSARELAPEKNPQANSWVNQRITFTHGVGLAMAPVNEATDAGRPVLFIKDLPPVSVPGAPVVRQFRIYFGERRSDYVIVGARQPEFDYPFGAAAESDLGAGQTTSWTGTTGIRLENMLTRLLFAARFRDLNLLISDQVTAQSQILFHRSLGDRLQLIAPFLRYDRDPYLVVGDDGRLVWIQDAYTVSDRFPNAQYFDPTTLPGGTGLGDAPINYLRNSVKVVMDAYDGRMTFYAADPNDPILRAYEGVFPTLFQPLDRLPADLQPHLRVPEELFNVQTRMFATYHVTAPATFYNRGDLWTVPTDVGGDQSLPSEAYYVMMRMPGEDRAEFLLLQPMVPAQRPNMIAWVAARNDAPSYGQVRVYEFPENTSVLGPKQIEAQIDADPTISAQITLWNQSGSKVIRGNLIVIPVQDSLIYLQPVYLVSTSSALPELQKVILASATKIVWGDSLGEALDALIGRGTGTAPGGGPGAGPTPGPGATPAPSAAPGATPPAGDVRALVRYANDHFALAQQALKNGDFATYGAEMRLVEEALRQLAILTGPSPAP